MEEKIGNTACYYKRKTLSSIAITLKDVFDQIDMAASSGKYGANIKEELSDDQLEVLEGLGFELTVYDEDDTEWDEGIKYLIEWEQADLDEDDNNSKYTDGDNN
jgi:hypothetical protein